MTSLARPAGTTFRQFVRFLLVGVVNTLVGLGVIYAGKYFFGLGDVAANVVGYAVGLTVSFVLNKRFTFNHSGAALRAAALFLLTFAIAYAVNLGVVLGLIHGFGANGYLAQAAGVPPYTITFFLLSKFMVFRAGPPPAA